MRAAMFALWALFRLQRVEPSIVDVPALSMGEPGFSLRTLLPDRPVTAAAGRGPPTAL